MMMQLYMGWYRYHQDPWSPSRSQVGSGWDSTQTDHEATLVGQSQEGPPSLHHCTQSALCWTLDMCVAQLAPLVLVKVKGGRPCASLHS